MMAVLIRTQRGSALILALVVILFAVIVGFGFAQSAASGKRFAAQERQLSQAYYAAESGLTEVLTKPDSYITELFEDNQIGPWYAGPFEVPGHSDLEFEVEIELVRPGVYEVRSFGHTAYASALAAAEANLFSLEKYLDSLFHMGGLGVPLSVPGTPSNSPNGRQAGVTYHFRGEDMRVYGSLTFETDAQGQPLQDGKHFNIWDGGSFLTWNHKDEGAPLPPADWLGAKHGENDEDVFPIDLALSFYDNLTADTPVEYDSEAILDQANKSLIISGNAMYEGTLKDGVTIEGEGYLRLTSTAGYEVNLIMHGDLTIWVDSDIEIGSIRPTGGTPHPRTYTTGGHRLVIISEGDILIGDRASEYDPYPEIAQDLQPLFLGNTSALWARKSLVIEGPVRAGMPSDYTEAELADPITIFTWPDGDDEDELTWIPYESPLPRGEFLLVSYGDEANGQHSLTAHTIDGAGIVIAGDSIKVNRMRLTGAALIQNPYELRTTKQGDKVVGLAELYLTAGDPDMLTNLGGQKLFVQLIRRTK